MTKLGWNLNLKIPKTNKKSNKKTVTKKEEMKTKKLWGICVGGLLFKKKKKYIYFIITTKDSGVVKFWDKYVEEQEFVFNRTDVSCAS